MDDYIQISTKAAVIMVACLNLMGFILKAIPVLPNRFVPLILVATGAASAGAVDGWKFEVLVIGAVAAMTAIGAHQTVSRTLRKDSNPTPPTQ